VPNCHHAASLLGSPDPSLHWHESSALDATANWAIGPFVGQAGNMAETLTMMAVPVHSDDEASGTREAAR
jgi:hypothetical protein